jgi:phenylacetic acid degradation operon negative regulatory protein
VRAVASLVRTFRQRRPLRGGSLLVTLVGDAVAPHGGDIALGSLIALAEPFGLSERLVRTAVSRLAHDGWFHTRRIGRVSFYRLTSDGTARFSEAARRIYQPPPELPDRTWTIVLIPGGLTARDAIARELLWLGFGRMTPEVFVHPTCAPAHVTAQLRPHGAADEVLVMQAAMQSRTDEQRLVQASWNLADLSTRYERLIRAFSPILVALRKGRTLSPADSFLVRTLLVHEYRRIVLRDPRLPTTLLPVDWAGGRAYAMCQALYGWVFTASETHLQQVAAGTAEHWSPLDASVAERFGGVLDQPLLERGLVTPEARSSSPRRRRVSSQTRPAAPSVPDTPDTKPLGSGIARTRPAARSTTRPR